MQLFSLVLDSLFPRQSFKNFTLVSEPVMLQQHSLTLRGLHALDTLLAAGRYDRTPFLKNAILRFKYGRDREQVLKLSALLVDTLLKEKWILDLSPTLCPVPLHWSRRFDRGFNQSLLLAESCAKATGLPCKELLKRVRPTGRQVKRKRRERLVALKGVFDCQKSLQLPKTVILIDDLSTTGATLEECAKTLKKYGVKTVIGLVLALG